MPGQTATYGLPYQSLSDPPHGPDLGQHLAEAVESELQRIDADVDALQARGSGIVPGGYGKRTTASLSTTTEVGVLRLDGLAVTAGRQYKISTSPLNMFSTVAGDLIEASIRVSTTGAATTTSTHLTGLVESAFSGGGSQRTQGLQVTYAPAATGALSVLLSVGRGGGGSGSVSILGSGGYPLEMWVEDMGPAAPNSGINI